jgi:uncharacterized protein (DUF433 family)
MNFEKPFDRITIEEGKMNGRPCIRGMRITVAQVLALLGTYPDRDQIFASYPDLEEEDLKQALAFASENLAGTEFQVRVA